MICPTCKSDMIVVEHDNIELDYCTNCNGVWFDAGEMDLLLQSIDVNGGGLLLKDLLNATEPASPEKKRKCPICSFKMKKTNIGENNGILIDICPRGDGIWFDGGEFVQLTRQLSAKADESQESQQQVIDFLADVFKAQQ